MVTIAITPEALAIIMAALPPRVQRRALLRWLRRLVVTFPDGVRDRLKGMRRLGEGLGISLVLATFTPAIITAAIVDVRTPIAEEPAASSRRCEP
jgi:hypothetical protein